MKKAKKTASNNFWVHSNRELDEPLLFNQISHKGFRKMLKKHFFGEKPFRKDQSFAAFVTRQNEKHYLGKDPYAELLFTYKFLTAIARQYKVKPSAHDKVTAYSMFRGIKNEAESVKCKHCCGHGYVAKSKAYGSKATEMRKL